MNTKNEKLGLQDIERIMQDNKEKLSSEMVKPMTKDTVNYLWTIKDFDTKKNEFLKEVKKFKFMKTEVTQRLIIDCKKMNKLDDMITNFFFKTEESCAAKNLRTLQKHGLAPLEDEE